MYAASIRSKSIESDPIDFIANGLPPISFYPQNTEQQTN